MATATEKKFDVHAPEVHCIADELLKIRTGMTRIVRGEVVTRWGADAFEVGTWGKTHHTALFVAWTIANETAFQVDAN